MMRGALDEKGVCLIWLHAASLMHCLSLQQSCSQPGCVYLLLLCSSARFGQISMQAEILHAVTRDSEPPRPNIYWRTHCDRSISLAAAARRPPSAHNKSAAAGINQSAAVLEKESPLLESTHLAFVKAMNHKHGVNHY